MCVTLLIFSDFLNFYPPGHLLVSLLCHCKYVRVHVPHVLARVCVNDCVSIERKLLVGIHSHQDNTWKQHKLSGEHT